MDKFFRLEYQATLIVRFLFRYKFGQIWIWLISLCLEYWKTYCSGCGFWLEYQSLMCILKNKHNQTFIILDYTNLFRKFFWSIPLAYSLLKSSSRWTGSSWRKTKARFFGSCCSILPFRIPSIIDRWFPASEKHWAPGKCLPSNVEKVSTFAT